MISSPPTGTIMFGGAFGKGFGFGGGPGGGPGPRFWGIMYAGIGGVRVLAGIGVEVHSGSGVVACSICGNKGFGVSSLLSSSEILIGESGVIWSLIAETVVGDLM